MSISPHDKHFQYFSLHISFPVPYVYPFKVHYLQNIFMFQLFLLSRFSPWEYFAIIIFIISIMFSLFSRLEYFSRKSSFFWIVQYFSYRTLFSSIFSLLSIFFSRDNFLSDEWFTYSKYFLCKLCFHRSIYSSQISPLLRLSSLERVFTLLLHCL